MCGKTGLNLCNKARDILKSLVKVTNVTGVETVACKPVSTPGSASSPEFSTKILEQKSFCTFRDPILRDRTIRLTNIMTDWSKQRKHGLEDWQAASRIRRRDISCVGCSAKSPRHQQGAIVANLQQIPSSEANWYGLHVNEQNPTFQCSQANLPTFQRPKLIYLFAAQL